MAKWGGFVEKVNALLATQSVAPCSSKAAAVDDVVVGDERADSMKNRLVRNSFLAFLLVVVASSCTRDNGLPADITALLVSHDFTIRASGVQAPRSSRAGFIYIDRNVDVEAKIVRAFRLEKIDSGDRRFERYGGQIREAPLAMWGIAGRPTSLRLKNGSQFEYLYLLATASHTYVFAEYAYG
jgi:hypothetical protein